jgi:hypothetical protein
MFLLVLHFNKADESHKSKKVEGLSEILQEVFGKDSIEKFENPSAMPSLNELYMMKESDWFSVLEKMREAVVEILHQHCGMGTYCFRSRDNDEIFCKVQYDDDVLLREAESTCFLMRVKKELGDNEIVQENMPYVPFEAKKVEIYQRFNGKLLRDVDRIHLMEEIIRGHIKIEALVKYKILIDFYPLHNQEDLTSLKDHLLSFNLKSLDISKLRDYFGEKLCLYFIWLEFYAKELLLLGILGILVWLIGWFWGSDHEGVYYRWVELAFALLVCLWCAMFQIKWQRKSNLLSLKFGTRGCKLKEIEREQFLGKLVRNSVTGELEKVFDRKIKIQRQIVTSLSTFFMVGLVVAFTLSLFFYRALLIKGGERGWGPMLIATLNTLQIYVMNLVYDAMAVRLNDWENHKTETEYENGLIVKKVGYQFVNYFISLYYIAFIKEHWDGCDNNNCMKELNYNLWVMFGLNMIFNVIEIGSPVLKARSLWKSEEEKVQKMVQQGQQARLDISSAERQGKQETLVILNEYLEVVMNLGYIIFFCVAFPLGPIIYWVFNVLEIKGDAFKFFTLFKRPFPRQAENIGVWEDVIHFLSIVGVVTNTALMIFTANIFDLPLEGRWKVFVVVEHLSIFLMVMILKYYPKNFKVTLDLEKKHKILKDQYFYKNVSLSGGKKAHNCAFTTDIQVHFKDNE